MDSPGVTCDISLGKASSVRYKAAPKQLLILVPLSDHSGHAGHESGQDRGSRQGGHDRRKLKLAGQQQRVPQMGTNTTHPPDAAAHLSPPAPGDIFFYNNHITDNQLKTA